MTSLAVATHPRFSRTGCTQTGIVIALGLVAGLPFAVLAARFAGNMLWGVSADDPWIYAASAMA